MSTSSWTAEEHNACMKAIRRGGLDWPAVAAQVKTKSVEQIQAYLRDFVMQKQQELQDIRKAFESVGGPSTAQAPPAMQTQEPAVSIAEAAPTAEDTATRFDSVDVPLLDGDFSSSMLEAVGMDTPADLDAMQSLLGDPLLAGPVLEPAASPHVAELHTLADSPQKTQQSSVEARWPTAATGAILGQPPMPGGKKQVRIASDALERRSLSADMAAGMEGLRGGPSHSRTQPDFPTVYAFIGSIFDPKCRSIAHEDVLCQMNAVDRRAVLVLVRNLSRRLSQPEVLQQFEARSRLLD